MNSPNTYNITTPEPFVLGGGQNKYPGGYLCKVLDKFSNIIFECLDITPQMAQKTCAIWCVNNEIFNKPDEQIVESKVENVSGNE